MRDKGPCKLIRTWEDEGTISEAGRKLIILAAAEAVDPEWRTLLAALGAGGDRLLIHNMLRMLSEILSARAGPMPVDPARIRSDADDDE